MVKTTTSITTVLVYSKFVSESNDFTNFVAFGKSHREEHAVNSVVLVLDPLDGVRHLKPQHWPRAKHVAHLQLAGDLMDDDVTPIGVSVHGERHLPVFKPQRKELRRAVELHGGAEHAGASSVEAEREAAAHVAAEVFQPAEAVVDCVEQMRAVGFHLWLLGTRRTKETQSRVHLGGSDSVFVHVRHG